MPALLVVALIVGLCVVLKNVPHKDAGGTGTSNGAAPVDGVTPPVAQLGAANTIGLYGGTEAPSPLSGLGRPSANLAYNSLQWLQPAPRGARATNAFLHSPNVPGQTLNPLPNLGTRSKQLLTKDVVLGPGRKL